MASNENPDEKPNLRPTKRLTAGGKTVFLHHNPRQPSNRSYIHADWRGTKDSPDREDPMGIDEPHIEYSLNKRQRWELLHSFRQHIANDSDSSSDDDRTTQSDDEQRRRMSLQGQQKKKRSKANDSLQPTKYRLYEFHNTDQQANCVSVTSNTGAQRVQVPKKTYMAGPKEGNRPANPNAMQEENRGATVDVTYYAVVPPPREKQFSNIRKQHHNKAKRATGTAQRSKFTNLKDRSVAVKQLNEDEASAEDEDDDDPSIQPFYAFQPARLQLDDFIPRVSTDAIEHTKPIAENLVTIDDKAPKSSLIYLDDEDPFKQSRKFHRQISKEEKMYNRDMATYIKRHQKPGEVIKQTPKSHHHLMSLAFRSILVDRTNLTVEYLSTHYGKDFVNAQCYPTKYLICLTNRLKNWPWLNQFELFPKYVTLHAYLIILVDEDSSSSGSQRVKVALNMDLYSNSVEIETLHESTYKISEVIEKSIEFITTLPFDSFKPIDSELNRKRLARNDAESELSDSEFLNKQIRQLQVMDKSEGSATALLEDVQMTSEANLEEYALIRPEICTSCYGDMNESIPMTALKGCAHWLCNDCWKQYLESSIKRVKVILCPEWNCESVVDVGTLLSLANVRCLNIYEGNIEKSLVNLSRSYVTCPLKSCSNITQVIGSALDHVRCRCGHQFCIQCKKEPHFPATCNAYRAYMDEVFRNGDLISEYHAITHVIGRDCVSCNDFIEKNGGCNHMTCRCGAEFCWVCTAYWKDHNKPDGTFACPRPAAPMQEQALSKQRGQSRRFYYNAIYHRYERVAQNQTRFRENAKRLLSTIPLEKETLFDDQQIRKQIDKRESILRNLLEIAKYIDYVHRICEFLAVCADGYAHQPSEFRNTLQTFEILLLNMSQVFEGGRGYRAVEQLKDYHSTCEKLIERIQRAVTLRELRRVNTTGYVTS